MSVAKRIMAKLNQWEFVDNRDGGSSGWRPADLKLIIDKKPVLEKLLSKSPVNFNLYFVMYSDLLPGNQEGLVVKEKKLFRTLPKRLRKQLEHSRQNAVTVFIDGLGNAVGINGNLPPTPWIITHSIAHVILKVLRTDSRYHYYLLLEKALAKIFLAMYGLSAISTPNPNDNEHIRKFMEDAFTFRSARSRRIRDDYEGWHELLTQYIITGKVRTNKKLPKRAWDLKNPNNKRKDDDAETDRKENEIWLSYRNEFQQAVKTIFDKALSDAKGKIFIV